MDTRPSPLTLVRLPNGQLAAVPSSVLSGAQLTLTAPPAPTPCPPPCPPPPPQQSILQSQGTTLVLRYPQQAQAAQKPDHFDPHTTMVDAEGHRLTAATAGTTANLTIVNGQYQFQQAAQFQQQVCRLKVASPRLDARLIDRRGFDSEVLLIRRPLGGRIAFNCWLRYT